MTASHAAPNAPGAGPTGPEGGDVGSGAPDSGSVVAPGSSGAASQDPIFRGTEAPERATKRSTLLFQFFLFPLLIVVASVGVFLFFGAIGGSSKDAKEYLAEIRSGGENQQKQASQQLALLLQEEEARVRAGKSPDRPPFYADPAFRAELKALFVDSFGRGHSTERRVYLAAMLGRVGDPDFLEVLRPHVAASAEQDAEVRRTAVWAVARLATDDVVPVLAGLVKDSDESVANFAVQGLSLRNTPDTVAALKVALAEGTEFVKDNAAMALALHGDPAGAAQLERLLDPAEVDRKVARPAPPGSVAGGETDGAARTRRGVLVTAIRGAEALRLASLRAKVEALAKDGDADVRTAAREALDRWK